MAKQIIKTLLEKYIGLSENALSYDIVEKAFSRRMSAVNITDIAEYAQYIIKFKAELDELIELLVVPETWFFRNRASFDFLENYIKSFPAHAQNKKIRILSLPCSTGEEPYSIVMTLIKAGMEESGFHVDAADISDRVLRLAGIGNYHQAAFRGEAGNEYCKRFFKKNDGYYKIHTGVKSNVRFLKENLLDKKLLSHTPCYDIIFCRNLLIYLSDSAKKKAVKNIDRLLCPKGLLFLGHAENEPFRNAGFEWISPARAFVCRKKNGLVNSRNKQDNTGQKIFLTNKDLPGPTLTDPRVLQQPGKKIFKPVSLPETASIKKQETKQTRPPEIEKKEKNLLETAHLLADKGELDEAFKKCREYLKKHPANARAHYLMSVMYLSVENYNESEKYLNKTIYLDPCHCDAMEQLSLIEEHRGNFAKAKQFRQRIRRILERKEKP